MSARDEILALEEQLRQAELAPDPAFFERRLADDAVLDGQLNKAKVVAAHQPSGTAKFTKVEMSDFQLHEHGPAVVVTCTGLYEGLMGSHRLNFMRVWLKQGSKWQIIAASIWQKP
jgi:hypothetical protein